MYICIYVYTVVWANRLDCSDKCTVHTYIRLKFGLYTCTYVKMKTSPGGKRVNVKVAPNTHTLLFLRISSSVLDTSLSILCSSSGMNTALVSACNMLGRYMFLNER